MSLADEVLADHKPKSWPGAVDWCEWCTDKWPCESVRLATQLRAAEQVVTAARELAADNERRGLHGAHVLKVKMRLAEYEQRAAVTFPRASTADKEKAR